MKKMTLLLVLALSASAYAGPRVVGNGGGGIIENGVYKTFYSAGVLVNPREARDIPGLSLLQDTILSMTSDTNIFPAIMPSGARKYFDIIESKINSKNIERLLEEYRRVVGQGNNIAIFAITDIPTKTTYLMPTFYKLTETEQAAILFHEAYWIMNPKATYHEVVSREIAFQEFVEGKDKNIYSSEFPRLLGDLVNDNYISLRASMAFDIENNTVPDLITKDGIRLVNLYKDCKWQIEVDENWQSRTHRRYYYLKTYSFVGQPIMGDHVKCYDIGKEDAQIQYMKLRNKYPQSKFVNELLNRALMSDNYFFSKEDQVLFFKDENLTKKISKSMNLNVGDMSNEEFENLMKNMNQFLGNYRIRFDKK